MTELTPRNRFPYPSELTQPYFPDIQAFFLADDAAQWAVAENGNLTYDGGGLFSWSAINSTLTWVSPITITPFTSAQQATAIIQGPPAPGGTLTIADGQVAFYTMPRLMQQNTIVNLQVGTRIYQSSGTRMCDLRLFCARVGNTLLFPDGKSLESGQSAVLFGGGTGTTIPPHVHLPALIIEPPTIGVGSLDLQVQQLGDEALIFTSMVGIFSSGDVITGSVSASQGIVVAVQPTFITVTGLLTVNMTLASAIGFAKGDTIQSGSSAIQAVITNISGTVVTANVIAGTWPTSGNVTDTTSATTTTYVGGSVSGPGVITGPGFTLGETLTSNANIVHILISGPVGTFTVGDQVTAGGATGVVEEIFGSPTPTSFYVRVTSGFFPVLGPLTDSTSGATATITNTILIGSPTASVISINPPSNLLQVDLFRNGLLQAEGSSLDYTLNYGTGVVTLNVPTVTNSETFIALREAIPTGNSSTEHQHLKLTIPIVVTTVDLDMQLSSLNPSPNTLVDVYLYRNGALQAQPQDYSLDTITGIVTLVSPASPGEYFIADRLVD